MFKLNCFRHFIRPENILEVINDKIVFKKYLQSEKKKTLNEYFKNSLCELKNMGGKKHNNWPVIFIDTILQHDYKVTCLNEIKHIFTATVSYHLKNVKKQAWKYFNFYFIKDYLIYIEFDIIKNKVGENKQKEKNYRTHWHVNFIQPKRGSENYVIFYLLCGYHLLPLK